MARARRVTSGTAELVATATAGLLVLGALPGILPTGFWTSDDPSPAVVAGSTGSVDDEQVAALVATLQADAAARGTTLSAAEARRLAISVLATPAAANPTTVQRHPVPTQTRTVNVSRPEQPAGNTNQASSNPPSDNPNRSTQPATTQTTADAATARPTTPAQATSTPTHSATTKPSPTASATGPSSSATTPAPQPTTAQSDPAPSAPSTIPVASATASAPASSQTTTTGGAATPSGS